MLIAPYKERVQELYRNYILANQNPLNPTSESSPS